MAIFIIHQKLEGLDKLISGQDMHSMAVNSNVVAKLDQYFEEEGTNYIIYQSPIELLASLLEVEKDIDTSLYTLKATFKQLCDFFKEHRQNCKLVSLDGAMQQSIAEEELNSFLTEFAVQITKPDPFDYLLAAYSLQNNKSIDKVIKELVACSIGAQQADYNSLDLNQVLYEWVSVKQKLERFSKTNEVLESKLSKSVDELRYSHSKEKALEADKQVLQKSLTELQQENDLAIEQLHQVQGQFESKLQALSHLEQGLEAEKEVRQTEKESAQEIQAELESKLSKSVYELRYSHSKEKALEADKQVLQKSLTELQQENELIIEQLHYVQELFEHELTIKQRQKLRIQELDRDISDFKKQINDAEILQTWLRVALHKSRKRLWAKNRNFRSELKAKAKLLLQSEEFNAESYKDMYPDINSSKLDPAVHFLLFGVYEVRNPSSSFNTLNYIQCYQDVSSSGMNPLIHFLKFGQFEGRKANPMQLRLPAPKQ